MKYLLLFLVSTSAFALDFWEPHEKDLAVLEWRAAQTPQEKLAQKFSKIENMDYEREFKECDLVGVKKIATSAPQAECVRL